MKIKLPGSELNRMMKTISQCVDPKRQDLSNVEITSSADSVMIRATNGQLYAVMTTPVLGCEEEVFCIDGDLFAKVCSMCAGDITIETNGKTCTITGVGRTRIPIVDANIPAFESIKEDTVITIRSQQLSAAYNGVAHAISADPTRIALTGIKAESLNGVLSLTTLDGFRLAYESQMFSEKHGSEINAVIPGTFMKLLCNSTVAGELITLSTDGKRIKAETDGMMIGCTLLSDSFPEVKAIVPKEFATEVLLKADYLRSVLKSNSIVCASNKLVKLIISDDKVTVTGNSEQAEYDADISCNKTGPDLTIAFNQKYLMDTINSITDEEIVMKFNAPSNPCVITTREGSGYRLVLPVRVKGGN